MLKIGSVGTSAIMRLIQQAIAQTSGMMTQVVYSRQLQRAEAFAKEIGAPEFCDDYSAMVKRDDIDVIYIASPNSLHVQQALQAMQQGKHVIVEKPMAVTAADAQLLAQTARQHGVFLLEAITTLFMPDFVQMRAQLPRLGRIQKAEICYGQYSSRYDAYLRGENPNIFNPAMQGGALNDMGVYCVHAAVDLFGAPRTVRYRAQHGPNGVDLAGVAELEYPDFVCRLVTAKNRAVPNGVRLEGENGWLTQQGDLNAFAGCRGELDGEPFEAAAPVAENRMVHEMARFRDAIVLRDLEFRDRMLRQSVQVSTVLEQAHQKESDCDEPF